MNIFELSAKLLFDKSEYDKGLSDAESSASSFGSKVSKLLSGATKLAVAGVSAAAGGLVTLATAAVNDYASYEQLVGGVETLFGESASKVEKYANKAYESAGLSANEYMETVTSFSASLLSSLGNDTNEAAEYADRAVRDMSDNANKMGTDMSLIQNAYQGFAKQNYTMLDNLKLGYGGTQEEMQRLIQDASGMQEEMDKLGVSVDADSMSFGNIVNAISVMQEHMGIAGTTSEEAASTIEGSIKTMKSAWTNMLTGMADSEQDMGKLIDNLVESVVNVVKNIAPRIVETVPRLVSGLTELVEALEPYITPLMQDLLPEIVKGAVKLLASLADQLPSLIGTLWSSVKEGIDVLLQAIWDELPESVQDGLSGIMETLSGWFEKVSEAIQPFLEKVGELRDKFIEYVESGGLVTDVLNGIQTALDFASDAFVYVKDAVAGFIDYASGYAQPVIDGIKDAFSNLSDKIQPIIDKVVELKDKLVEYVTSGQASEDITNGVKNAISTAHDVVSNIKDKLEELHETFQPLIDKLSEIKDKFEEYVTSGQAAEDITTAVQDAINAIKDVFEALQEKLQPVIDKLSELKDKFEEWITSGQVVDDVGNTLKATFDFLSTAATDVFNAVSSIVTAVKDVVTWFTGASASAEAVKAVLVALTTVAAELTAAWVAHKAATEALNIATKAYEGWCKLVAAAQKILNAVMEANPIGIVIVAITALVAAFIYLWNNCESFRNFWIELWENIKSKFETIKDSIKEGIDNVKEKFDSFKEKIQTVHDIVVEKFEAIKEKFASVKQDITDKIDAIKDKFDGFREKMQSVVDRVKEIFDFDWEWPDIKLPHFNISGGELPWGIGGKGTAPSISVEWYKKAMDNATVLNGATIFGAANGQLLGGGEAGNEVVSGEDHLVQLINDSVTNALYEPIAQINAILQQYLPNAANKSIVLDDGTLVGKLANSIDSKLGSNYMIASRGY